MFLPSCLSEQYITELLISECGAAIQACALSHDLLVKTKLTRMFDTCQQSGQFLICETVHLLEPVSISLRQMNIPEIYGTLLNVSKERSKVKSFILTLRQLKVFVCQCRYQESIALLYHWRTLQNQPLFYFFIFSPALKGLLKTQDIFLLLALHNTAQKHSPGKHKGGISYQQFGRYSLDTCSSYQIQINFIIQFGTEQGLWISSSISSNESTLGRHLLKTCMNRYNGYNGPVSLWQCS